MSRFDKVKIASRDTYRIERLVIKGNVNIQHNRQDSAQKRQHDLTLTSSKGELQVGALHITVTSVVAYEADLLSCVRRAKEEVGADMPTGALTARQLPVTMMMDHRNLFMWQVTRSRATAFEQKHGLPVQVQFEFGRKMARLQFLKCLSSRNSGDWQVLVAEWRRALGSVVSSDIFNETLRFGTGQVAFQ
ncbi:hypothetical protein BCV69DRAFT_92044 [Microstroma glucosiphilum]|uniref:Uncharacterized protein n=1 Tax=Pseudomicrostroma glucosiphilum TaxID=1684307 RepID=A0A316TXT4_9BASI|nr:hypothetical protein BCV69DRAFT_92044 [Pseudomicrostroma glucosiphilum]PWN18027.1 hypothetical protein BCV69DRAFT_92044 [Pseudomicrostroma glucosiphilum]